MLIRVRIIVEDEWDEEDFDDLEHAKKDAEELCQEIRIDHLVSATVESVEVVE